MRKYYQKLMEINSKINSNDEINSKWLYLCVKRGHFPTDANMQ